MMTKINTTLKEKDILVHEDIKAEFKDGTLRVTVPESPKKDNKKLIDIE